MSTVKQAAITAKLLGYKYKIHKAGSISEGMVFSGVSDSSEVWVGTTRVAYWIPWRGGPYLPSETEALGHFLVRLDMEKRFGITTDHYWETR